MSEFVDNHPLSRDLPEFKEQIHTLKLNNAHFTKLMQKYESLDKEIVRIEQGVEYQDGLTLDGMKSERVHLKDELVSMLRKEKDNTSAN